MTTLEQFYADFVSRKSQFRGDSGFEATFIPRGTFDFQEHLIRWSTQKGRAAIFADCGLGKTLIQLAWAENVLRHTAKPVLILTPLAVGYQTQAEAERFGIEATVSREGAVECGIVITNYQRLHHFDRHEFSGVVCDESSILKSFDGATRKTVTEFMREIPYRLLCTATAAPNDYWELGPSSEALGYLGHRDMLTRFFKEDTVKDYLGWGRKSYRFRGHAAEPFWRWVCSWSIACRKPSDIGFSDEGFRLPRLREREVILESPTPRDGMLFAVPARDLREQREERRRTLERRCEHVAELACRHRLDNPSSPASVVWCHLNAEGKLLSEMIPDAVEVSGSMSDDEKEYRLRAFQSGDVPTLITKPKIGCYGLNWQHCNRVLVFPSHSWEQYYQAIRRCWRFGQLRDVFVDVVTTEGEVAVLANLQRKAVQADEMFSRLVYYMGHGEAIDGRDLFPVNEEMPAWL